MILIPVDILIDYLFIYKTTGRPGSNSFLLTAKLNASPVLLTMTVYLCIGAALVTFGVSRGTSYLAFLGSYICK